MRLALVISQLSGGGAERVLSRLAGYWADHGHDVTVITFWSASSDLYPLSPRVQRVALGLGRQSPNVRQSLRTNWRRLWALRRTIRTVKPQIVVSFMDTTNVLTLFATLGLGVPVVVSERIHPAYHDIGAIRGALRRWVYPWADAVVVPAGGIGRWLSDFVPPRLIHVIPNPAPSTGCPTDPPSDRKAIVVGMGRLEAQKQFDYLLRAFARCHAVHPNWSLAVMGEGPERKALETLAADLGIAAKVRWVGVAANPEDVLRESRIFVLSSRYEGFPNALVEAMANGLAAVSFDCPSGPREIIRDGVDGLLVPAQDLDRLADAMGLLMSDEIERKRLATKATEVRQRFSSQAVGEAWDKVFQIVRSSTPGRDCARSETRS
jgi:glycosyltransferase involved in cell wall biosynthesis